MSIPINQGADPGRIDDTRIFGSSYRSQNTESGIRSIAEESIARDLGDDDFRDIDGELHANHLLTRAPTHDSLRQQPSLLGFQSMTPCPANGPRPFMGLQASITKAVTEQDRMVAINNERDLLEDNNILSSSQDQRRASRTSMLSSNLLRLHSSVSAEDQAEIPAQDATHHDQIPTERTSLLGERQRPEDESPETIEQKFEDAVLAGHIHTTWQREAKVLAGYSAPLILTFALQLSLTMTSVFTVGHIGKNELGAVSLGGMTASITGYSVYHGLATSLDTLCAQAYGSGNKKLVGLNLQRMVFFLWTCTIPVAAIWIFAEPILKMMVPEKEVALLAGQYLRFLVIGAPAYACFESSKRYVQAQGKFAATMYVLLIAAPSNVLMHWLFVWRFEWGFIGCPIAVVVTEYLMVLLLFLYVRLVAGLDCWPGFSRKAFKNWGPMIRLALPGFVMVFAEFLAFEIITFASARISATHLATNAILMYLSALTYQLPFPVSIAGSTRISNFIGAGLPDAAKVTTRILFIIGTFFGLFNMIMLSSLRFYIPHLFTKDADVIELAAKVLPVNAAFQLFDALAAQCNGVLRGLGKQSVGSMISLVAFYAIGIPVSFGAAFGLHWDLYGLWAGPALALFTQFLLESIFIHRTSWQKASEEAAHRNAAG